MLFRLLPLLACLFFFSCAKLPVQSLSLIEAVETEGARMHAINTALLHAMFREKRDMVSQFIEKEYTPAAVENFKSQLPKETDYKADFAAMVQSLMPRINARKDSMLQALNEEQWRLLEKLDADYAVYQTAVDELKRLLRSAVKVDAEKQALFNTAKQVSNNRLDLAAIEAEIDRFILAGGSVGSNVRKLNDALNSLLKK